MRTIYLLPNDFVDVNEPVETSRWDNLYKPASSTFKQWSNPNDCPIARAFRREGIKQVNVGNSFVYGYIGKEQKYFSYFVDNEYKQLEAYRQEVVKMGYCEVKLFN